MCDTINIKENTTNKKKTGVFIGDLPFTTVGSFSCKYCDKLFSSNTSKNRHQRLYCNNRQKTLKQYEKEALQKDKTIQQLRNKIKELKTEQYRVNRVMNTLYNPVLVHRIIKTPICYQQLINAFSIIIISILTNTNIKKENTEIGLKIELGTRKGNINGLINHIIQKEKKYIHHTIKYDRKQLRHDIKDKVKEYTQIKKL